MTKATTSAVDFLAAISGGTETYEVAGVTVELRSLGYSEMEELNTTYADRNMEMAFQALARALVSPKLTPEQLDQLRRAKPGFIVALSQRVMQISGVMEEDENGSPLAGGGSR